MLGSRAIWHRGWKAVSVHPTLAGWGHFDRDRWELYDTEADPTECHDLAAEHPDKLRELVNLWFHEAGRFNGLPLVDRTAVEILADPSRPQVVPPRDHYVYHPGAAEVPSRPRSTSATGATASRSEWTSSRRTRPACCSRRAPGSAATPST